MSQMVEFKVEGKQDTAGIGVVTIHPRTTAVQYLDCYGLVIFEPAEAVLGFQGVAIGVLRRVEGGRWQIFPGTNRM